MSVVAGCEERESVAGVTSNRRTGSYPESFSMSSIWDDGLSEMSYYDAVDTIYGKPRHYVRVMLLNREWLNPEQRVKAERPQNVSTTQSTFQRASSIPVLKLNIVEEIPTENYNYRYMVTVFLHRTSLLPEKLSASSQEWCGTTFKQLQWRPEGLKIRGFSYFEGEADREWSLPAKPVIYPQESLFVLARAAVASDRSLDLQLLPVMRSHHLAEPIPRRVRLDVSRDAQSVRVPLGRFGARTVTVTGHGGKETARFLVEGVPPYRLLRHSAPGLELSLRYVERRAYWDRSKPSGFYRQGAAP
ncbi:MAG: hypothetical protein MI923_06950 [Phycisphaerales bacterium]|nr:hypothetical protein [Phycisphaerales bacterium]